MANLANFEVAEDTIFVTGLPEDTTEEQLSEFFGQIGIIKFDKKNDCPKIWIYKDKNTGKGKGEATITYDDPPTATSAITWFNGKPFRGSTLTIELAQRKSTPQYSRGGYRGGVRGGGGSSRGDGRSDSRGGYDRGGGGGDSRGGRSGASGRPGDWVCPSCNNNNFAYRHECNRCRFQKPAGEGGTGGGASGASSYNGSDRHFQGDDGARSRGYGNFRGSGGGGGGYNYRNNDLKDRGGREGNRGDRADRDRDRSDRGDRDRDRDRSDRGSERGNDRDRERDRSSRGGGSGYGGPSRSYQRGKDDRRSRPY